MIQHSLHSYFLFVEIRLGILFLQCLFIICVNFVFTASTYSKRVLLSHRSGEYLGVVAMEFNFWPETALRTKGCEPAPCFGPTTFSPQFQPLSINRFSKCCRDLQIIILIDINRFSFLLSRRPFRTISLIFEILRSVFKEHGITGTFFVFNYITTITKSQNRRTHLLHSFRPHISRVSLKILN